MQRSGSTRRSLFGAAMVLLILGSAVLAGCGGGDGDETAFVPVAGADSVYCDTYRAYKAQEIDGGGAYDQPNPAALRKWWNDYLIFEETMLREAPPEIRDEVAIKVSFIRTVMSPLLEKYDFDLKRMEREAAAEAASFVNPPPDVQKAEDAQHAYEARTCGTEPSPPAADVVFKADGSSKPFCTALSAFNSELDKVASSRFDPDVLRTLVTGDRFSEVLDGLDEHSSRRDRRGRESRHRVVPHPLERRRGQVRLRHPRHLPGRHPRGSRRVQPNPSRRPRTRLPQHGLRGADL